MYWFAKVKNLIHLQRIIYEFFNNHGKSYHFRRDNVKIIDTRL